MPNKQCWDSSQPTLAAAWKFASDLEEGDVVQGWNQQAQVSGIASRTSLEPVFNLEVDSDHVYRIGDVGVLVHNSSPSKKDCTWCKQFDKDKNVIEGRDGKPPGYKSWIEYIEKKCGATDITGCTASEVKSKFGGRLHGHHVIPKEIDRDNEMRELLCMYGINPYIGCANLVVSPNKCHSAAYTVFAKNRLSKIPKQLPERTADRQRVLKNLVDALRAIARAHRQCPKGGKLPIGVPLAGGGGCD